MNKKKLWRNKKLLNQKYRIEKIPTCKIAEEFNCSRSTVRNWIHKFGIPIVKKQPKGKDSPFWKGGKWISSDGRVWIRCDNHPRTKNGYVVEHTLIIEKHLGRYLTPEERVHHKNCIKIDNRLENLFLCKNMSEHAIIHNSLIKIGYNWAIKMTQQGKIIFDEETKTYKEVMAGND